MTTDRFRECLEIIGWSQRGFAAMTGVDERQVRRWATGATIPPRIAEWLDKLARYHERNPPPQKGDTND